MASYHLQIVTPDGLIYDGQAEKLTVRTTTGDVCILARHINYVAALGMGVARIDIGGEIRKAACIGGMLSVYEGAVKLVPTTFEWAEEIDKERATQSEARARQLLDKREGHSEQEIALAEARLKRALVRQSAARTKS